MLEFRVLGPVGLWSDGAEVPLGGCKQRTTLAALLLADGAVVSDSDLGGVLWEQRPPATYQAQIYTYASRLRGLFRAGATITRRGRGYRIERGDARFDLDEFHRLAEEGQALRRSGRTGDAADRLRAALDLWSGPTLTGVTDALVDNERSRIEMARMEALESRIDADLHLGRHRQLIIELTQLVGAHPLRETFRAKLMIALHRSDRQAEAFETFHAGCALLREQLGVDPGPTLHSAHRAILAGVFAPALSGRGDLVAGPTG
ncbi:AfsR/SARP family transcriptional regulator [Streptomyces sp. SCL15-4]|uniref:AfsR/SARP family transcriptional regulator n=1 Tax=Streptomyces sp. SCL15-4 TaxID=2967221 RepID=UPI002966A7FD|nr:AfsR/SARP family transcriptional regulator [Streptomyces sp. SCL15-4]